MSCAQLKHLDEAVPLVTQNMEHYLANFGPACKSYVPQKEMAAASQLYTALLERKEPAADGGAAGKRLASVLMSIVSDRKPAPPPPEPPSAVAGSDESLATTAAALSIQDLMAQPDVAAAIKTLQVRMDARRASARAVPRRTPGVVAFGRDARAAPCTVGRPTRVRTHSW
jgi:hypothetical protein